MTSKGRRRGSLRTTGKSPFFLGSDAGVASRSPVVPKPPTESVPRFHTPSLLPRDTPPTDVEMLDEQRCYHFQVDPPATSSFPVTIDGDPVVPVTAEPGPGRAPQEPSGLHEPPVAVVLEAPAPREAPASIAKAAEAGTPEFGRILDHLAKHGSVTEPEVAALLGSPRLGRRFAAELDDLLSGAPLRVRVEFTNGIKRYVRDDG